MEELDDITLARAQRKERDARTRLIRVYEGPVYALLSRMMVARPDLVDDLAQDTFVKVLEGVPRFKPGGPAKLSTWILTIATRTAIDTLRKPSLNEASAPERADPAPGPEGLSEAAQLQRRVVQAMATLDEEQRAVLVLRAYHDLDYAQIAQVLELSVGTVKSRLSRARVELKRAMQGAKA